MRQIVAHVALSTFIFAFYVVAVWIASLLTGVSLRDLLPFTAMSVVAMLESRIILKGTHK